MSKGPRFWFKTEDVKALSLSLSYLELGQKEIKGLNAPHGEISKLITCEIHCLHKISEIESEKNN